MDTISTTIQEWYSKAIHFQTQWEQAEENSKRNQHPSQHLYQPFTTNILKIKDPNTIDIDIVHIRKLISNERKCCIEKGLCFHCCKAGHLSRECPCFPNMKSDQQVKQVTKKEELPSLQEINDDDDDEAV